MTDTEIEKEIKEKGLTAPRVTSADIDENIVGVNYFTAAQAMEYSGVYFGINDPLHFLTFCVLVLRNGFTVTGESACASPENFNAELGRKIAYQNAVNKIWPLMGYALKDKLAQQQTPT
jgi:hypothetical protein